MAKKDVPVISRLDDLDDFCVDLYLLLHTQQLVVAVRYIHGYLLEMKKNSHSFHCCTQVLVVSLLREMPSWTF